MLPTLSILFIDLDNFKRINDTLGHPAGDKLLEAFAERLTACVRESDVISHEDQDTTSSVMARLAGDEFTIMLPRTTGAAAAQKVARRILERLTEPFTVNRQELFVSASIGIALYPDDGLSVDELMKHADIAMYHAKKSGRNNYQYYRKQVASCARERRARGVLPAADVLLYRTHNRRRSIVALA
jgi:diguanylate cyclase (GGDEF)-like protein